MGYDRTLIKEGEWRLRQMLPEARKIALEMNFSNMSGLAEAMRPYLYEANFRALVVAPGEKGGWIADLLLHDVPPGVSNTMGTPVHRPCETKFEAIEMGKRLIAIAIKMHDGHGAGVPRFLLHAVEIELVPEVMRKAEDLFQMAFAKGLDREECEAGLRRAVAAAGFLDACTVEMFDALPMDQAIRLMSTLHAAAAAGILAWPLRKAEPVGKSPMEPL